MPTVKIANLPKETNTKWVVEMQKDFCFSKEHRPRTRDFGPGIWQHVCPECGKSQVFIVRNDIVFGVYSLEDPIYSDDFRWD